MRNESVSVVLNDLRIFPRSVLTKFIRFKAFMGRGRIRRHVYLFLTAVTALQCPCFALVVVGRALSDYRQCYLHEVLLHYSSPIRVFAYFVTHLFQVTVVPF